MKSSTIALKISRKVDEWLASIEDADLRAAVAPNVVVSGGCIASMLLNEPVNDYDVYFTDFATTLAVTNYYLRKFQENPPPRFKDHPIDIKVVSNGARVKIVVQSVGVASESSAGAEYNFFEQSDPDSLEAREYLERVTLVDKDLQEDKPYRPVLLTANAITLTGNIQLVIRFYGSPAKIHDNFDFVHCINYWSSGDRQLHLRKDAMESLLTRTLVYRGSLYPLCSILRMRKFLKRGWTIHAGQVLKMVLQAADLDWKDPAVMEEQLTGVDFAYFQEVLQKVKEGDPTRIDRTYLMALLEEAI